MLALESRAILLEPGSFLAGISVRAGMYRVRPYLPSAINTHPHSRTLTVSS